MMENLLWVFLGGGMGSSARFLLSSAVQKASGGAFPWGTLVVNMIGCYCIGSLWSLSGRISIPFSFSVFLFAGILGGFTTMSSFSLEAFSFCHDGAWRMAAAYVVLTNILGLGLAAAGFYVTEFFIN